MKNWLQPTKGANPNVPNSMEARKQPPYTAEVAS
jgi:hypothetical protein